MREADTRRSRQLAEERERCVGRRRAACDQRLIGHQGTARARRCHSSLLCNGMFAMFPSPDTRMRWVPRPHFIHPSQTISARFYLETPDRQHLPAVCQFRIGKNMDFKNILVVGILLSLPACSLTLPVTGQLENGEENFTGTATGYLSGSGDLQIVSNKGTVCTGNFVYVTRRDGEGVFTCNDGRSGPFKFVSTGQQGTGTGRLGGRLFTFTFGEFGS